MPYPSHRRPVQNPIGELRIIDRIRARASSTLSRSLRLGIGDDCAILKPPHGHELLVTTDFSLENRHFRRNWHSPASIGHRTLARGLSDLAAMGAKPLAAFLSLAMPKSIARNPRWLDGFLGGLLALATAHDVPLAGGDTAQSPADLILADVPCTGSGTWSRTPEALYFFNPATIEKYRDRQREILRHIAPQLAPDATLVYCTCSVFKRENEEMTEWIRSTFGLQAELRRALAGYDQHADTLFAARFGRRSLSEGNH